MNLKTLFRRRKLEAPDPLAEKRKLFPEEQNDFWYCGEFNDYQYALMQAGKPWHEEDLDLPTDRLLINPFSNYSEIREGAVLPCIKLDGHIGFYEITKQWRPSSFGDYLGWDDGYHVNLKLHHIMRAPPVTEKHLLISDCLKWNRAYRKMWYCVGVKPGSYCTAAKSQFGDCPFRRYKPTYNRARN